MNAEIIDTPPRRAELAKFSLSDAAIAKLQADYGGLTVAGPTDAAGQKACHAGRMVVRGYRTSIEKTRKDLKADALAYGREVDGEAKRLSAPLEAIEAHLEAQEQIVENERLRVAKVAEDARRAVMAERLATLRALGSPLGIDDVSRMTEDEHAAAVSAATTERAERQRLEADAKRIAAEQAEANRIEREALAAERAAQAETARIEAAKLAAEREALAKAQREQDAKTAAERAQLDAQAAEQRAAQKALDDAAAAVQRKADDDKLAAEAEARGKAETEARIKRELEQAEAERQERAEEQAREEAARPYRERVQAFADALMLVPRPEGPDFDAITAIVNEASAKIRALTARRKSAAKVTP